jgi:hypothetical protein
MAEDQAIVPRFAVEITLEQPLVEAPATENWITQEAPIQAESEPEPAASSSLLGSDTDDEVEPAAAHAEEHLENAPHAVTLPESEKSEDDKISVDEGSTDQ